MTLSSSRQTYSLAKTKKALNNMPSEKPISKRPLNDIANSLIEKNRLLKNKIIDLERRNNFLQNRMGKLDDATHNLSLLLDRMIIAHGLKERDEVCGWFEIVDLTENALKEAKKTYFSLRESIYEAEQYKKAFERAAGFIASNAQEYLGCDPEVSLQEGMDATKKALQELEVLRELKLSGDIS